MGIGLRVIYRWLNIKFHATPSPRGKRYAVAGQLHSPIARFCELFNAVEREIHVQYQRSGEEKKGEGELQHLHKISLQDKGKCRRTTLAALFVQHTWRYMTCVNTGLARKLGRYGVYKAAKYKPANMTAKADGYLRR